MKRIMYIILIGVVVIIVLISTMSYTTKDRHLNEVQPIKKEQHDTTKMLPFIQKESILKQSLPDIESQYEICPPLRPERFRRRMKMLFGTDIAHYPKGCGLLMVGNSVSHFIDLENQLFAGYDPFIEIMENEKEVIYTAENNPYADWENEPGPDAIYLINPSDEVYSIFRKFVLINDMSCIDVLNKQRIQQMDSLWKNPENKFALDVFNYETQVSLDMIYLIYINSFFTVDMDVVNYIDTVKIEDVGYFFLRETRGNTDLRQDIIWLYSLQTQQDNLYKNFYAGEYNWKLQNIISDASKTSKGGSNTNNRSTASFLDFMLRPQDKEFNKFVIQFMSGQLDYQIESFLRQNGVNCKKIREDIKSKNYYGYTTLREFCENPMREMPTLDKIGTNFKAKVNNPNSLLLLEPFPDSYDIDTIQTTETFKAYEMGHDDYYFIEIEKPVESPVADSHGYAMIIDRTETVYGYLPKIAVRAYTAQDVLKESQYTDKSKSKLGFIQDKDGYVNIRKEANAQSEIISKIRDKEIFHYWETTNNWYVIETSEGLRGYMFKDRIREKVDAGGWIIEE